MALTEFITEAVNLNNCDREPIHIPGSIQPHGILFVLSEPDFTIIQTSNNTAALIGYAPTELLGRNLADLVATEQMASLQACLQGDFECVNPLQLTLHCPDQALPFYGIIHRSLQGKLILELEPPNVESNGGFSNFYRLSKGILAKMQQTVTLIDLCQVIVQEIRKITQFQRVMVYQFAADGSGTVIAEAKQEDIESYLGLRYPDSDIPKQAKQLYSINPLRLIPDVNYQPASLVPADDPPLDLSFSGLRSVSPIHIEYLKNMGVTASMSISLIKDNALWGLVACHHHSPKFLPYDLRTLCEFLGQVMSLEIASKVKRENLDYQVNLKSIQTQFIDSIVTAKDFAAALLHNQTNLLQLVGAEGAAIYTEEELILVGKTPDLQQVQALVDWLEDEFHNHLFVTDSLPALYSPALEYKEVASGLLALSITKVRKNYVLWFRPEIVQQVHWAGNPDKPKRLEEDGSLTIFPRQSFELWQEAVYLKSLPWQAIEIEGAIELRSAIVGIILRKADELAAVNLELERSNTELDAFAYIASHDLKEPLRGIHNYSTFLLEDYADVLNQEGVEKLETLVRLTKRMEDLINALLHFSRLGRQELNLRSLDLNKLVQDVSDVFKVSHGTTNIDIRIPRSLPTIQGDQILIEEVFTNLIGNALKYNDRAEKWVEIGFVEAEQPGSNMATPADVTPAIEESSLSQSWTLYVRDNGIGIREKHLDTVFRIFKRLHAPGKYGGGTGAGLTIVKKVIERHGGQIWISSTYGEGTTFYFTLPA